MESGLTGVCFLLMALVLEHKLAAANICASNPMVLNSTSGKFTSPNYPNQYPHNTTKTWKIVAPAGQVIDLYFATFKLELDSQCGRSGCGCDYVKLWNKCIDSVPIATYCGLIPRSLRSRSNILWVKFRSDSKINNAGFEAIFKTNLNSSKFLSCPQQSDSQANIDYCLVGGQIQCCNKDDSYCRVNRLLTAKTGTITSPGYPGYYPHNTLYKWRITAPEGYVVQLNFTTLITYHHSSCSNIKSKCNCDFVAAFDGPCIFNIGTKWCGGWTWRYLYPSFITTGRHMLVAFKSDRANNHVGFEAKYRIALKCSGEKPISCVNNGSPSCCLRSATICHSGTSTRTHCPRDGDPNSYIGCCIVNGSPSCCPVLQSNHNISCPRPSDNQAYIDACSSGGKPTCCSKNLPVCRYHKLLTAASGTITSPGYPLRYPPNTVLIWRITVPEGFFVQLNFTKLAIERGSRCLDCSCDYVGVRDGPCSNISGTKWCGNAVSNKLPSFISTGRHLQVFFKSDALSTVHDGFVANYQRALNCSGKKPYSCLNDGEPACCKGTFVSPSSTKLWIALVALTIVSLM